MEYESPEQLNIPPWHAHRIKEQLGDIVRRNKQYGVDKETNFTKQENHGISGRDPSHGASRRILLHIGKCGGNVVKQTVGTDYFDQIVHISRGRTFRPMKGDDIYIAVRDPIARVVSAWKWRKYLVWWGARMADTRCPLCDETTCLDKFSSISKLGEALDYSKEAEQILTRDCIRHVNQGFEYYVGQLIVYLSQNENRVELLRQEHLPDDVYHLFGKKVGGTTHYTGGKTSSSSLSEKARQNLRSLLDSEYRIYHWLLSLKQLDP